jgi:membrane fusion protein (multidrug efflux system)
MLNKLVITLVMATTLLSACNNHESEKVEADLKLAVTNPIRKDTSIIKEYVAQVHAFRHIELRALEKGYLQDTFVDEGQTVNKGQKMFKIMPSLYEVDLLKAKAEADLVRIEFKNTKALADKNIVSATELALANAKLNKALAEVKLAQTHLDFTNINAPFTGIMDRFNVRNGSLVDEGDLLTTLSDISKVWVYFNVPESEYLDYKTNKIDATPVKVKLKMANGAIFNQDGVIETIEADFDNKTGNIEFRAAFPNPDQILRHGQTGNIQIDIPYQNALIIPQKATFEVLDKIYVYAVNKDNKLEQKLIEIAAELPQIYLVKTGLKENDRVLIEGLRKVQNGQKITPNFQSPEKTLSQLTLHAE